MKLKIYKEISLEKYGEEWKGCFLRFRVPSVSESLTVNPDPNDMLGTVRRAMERIQELFIAGRVVDEERGVVDMTAADVSALPQELTAEVFALLNGEPDPKL
jgi:hypothetical protein